MLFEKDVQFLTKGVTNNGLNQYDFLDLESNLPFSVYGLNKVESYEKLETYKVYNKMKFRLLLCKTKTGIAWKVKAVS